MVVVGDEGPTEETGYETIYRAYNPNDGDHLYTKSESEYNEVVAAGWAAEGIAWYTPEEGAPVYRLYNPNTGEHFYTKSESEYNDVAEAGWVQEGVAFYSANSEDTNAVPVYRDFNPNAKGPGSHLFTKSKAESNELVSQGWKFEGIGFYGININE